MLGNDERELPTHTTLHRLERGEHRLTLDKLQIVLEKLKIKLSDVFPEQF